MNKSGNICIIILPTMMLMFTVIIITAIVTYIQISTQLYDIKLSIDNMVMSCLTNEDFENISYRDYKINENLLKENIEYLLEKNYVKEGNKKTGVVQIWCEDVKVLNTNLQNINHGKVHYDTPIICTNIKLKFSPIISLIGKEKIVTLHTDVKLSLLEFS